MARKSTRARPALSVHRLEDRVVPAGTVTALVAEGVLYVQGDDASNLVWVQATGRNQVTLLPTDGTTTVNGQSAPVTLGGVTRGLYIQLGGGNDSLNIDGVGWNTALFVDTGDGNDTLALSHCFFRRGATVVTGAGDDYVSIGGSDIRGTTSIPTGDGNDTVNLGWTRFDRLILDGGAGANRVGAPSVKLRHHPQVNGFTVSPTLIPLTVPSSNPTAQSDSLTVSAGSSATVNVAANDSAPQGTLDLSSVTIITPPTKGTVSVNGTGTVTYTSTGTTAGTDSFRYTIRNSSGAVSNSATVSVTITAADTNAPSVTLSTPTTSPSNAPSFPFTATFSEDVTGFGSGGITATGAIGGFTRVDARTYNFTVTPSADGTVLVTANAGAAQDAAGNLNTASNTVTLVSDRTAPVVTADALTTTATNPTLTGTVDDATATVVVTVAGQTLTATRTGTTWSAAAAAVAEGTYDIAVTATDTSGNVGTTTRTGGLVVNRTDPTVRLATDVGDPTNAASFLVTAIFSEPVTGFDETDLTVTNGTVAGFGPRGSTTFRFTVIPTTDGPVTVTTLAGSATDLAGNPTTVDASLTRTSDQTPPTVTISTPRPQTSAAPIPYTMTFSEPVLGLLLNRLVVTNGTAGDLQQVDDRTYTFTVDPDTDGDVTVALPARAVGDAAGNRNQDSNTVTVTFSFLVIDPLVTNSTTPTITGTVRDPAATVDVTVGGQTFAAVVTGTTWSAIVPAALGEGTYDVTVTATTVTGPVTQSSTGGLVVDLTAPAVTIDPLTTGAITGTASDAGSGVVGVDLSVFDGTNFWDGTAFASVTEVFLDATTSDGWATWSIPFTSPGSYTVHVRATDGAGNVGEQAGPVQIG